MQYNVSKSVIYQETGSLKTIFGFINITFTFAEN